MDECDLQMNKTQAEFDPSAGAVKYTNCISAVCVPQGQFSVEILCRNWDTHKGQFSVEILCRNWDTHKGMTME